MTDHTESQSVNFDSGLQEVIIEDVEIIEVLYRRKCDLVGAKAYCPRTRVGNDDVGKV